MIFSLIAIVCLCKSPTGRDRQRETEKQTEWDRERGRKGQQGKERICFKIRMYHSKFLAANKETNSN